jgi:IS1 family transposase
MSSLDLVLTFDTNYFTYQKKNKTWLWTAVDPFKQGILGWVLGDPSAKTLTPLWAIVGA